MNKEILRKIIIDQQNWIEYGKDNIERHKLKEIKPFLKLPHIIAITGPRRSGKSVFLSQIIHKYYKNTSYYYISFDDERLLSFKIENMEILLEELAYLYGKAKIIFMDEIQNINGWEKFVSRLYNSGYKIFITGSNANLLSSELSTYLTGRHITVEISVFSFAEFLDFKKFHINKKTIYKFENRVKLSKYLDEYLLNGGFPETIKYGESRLLLNYFSDILTKDIINRYKIEEIKTLKEIALFLVSNSANLLSYNKIKNTYNVGSVHTVKNYSEYLQSAYLIEIVNKFSFSLKEQHTRLKKVYAIDTGMFNTIGIFNSPNKGKSFETSVFLELKRREKEIYYYKSEDFKEVDFIIKEKNKITELIQVCIDLSNEKTKKREIDGLLSAMKTFKLNKGMIITSENREDIKINNKNIKIISLSKFLLSL